MILIIKSIPPFTRRRFLQTSTAVAAMPTGAVPVAVGETVAKAKTIESIGLSVMGCDYNGKRLLGHLWNAASSGNLTASVLGHSPYRDTIPSATQADYRRGLFKQGGDILSLLNSEADLLQFLTDLPPEDVLKANDFFNPPNDSETWTENGMVYVNHRLDENRKRFSQSPEVHRYIHESWLNDTGGSSCVKDRLRALPIEEQAEELFDRVRHQVAELYRFHAPIAQFLHLMKTRGISVKTSKPILDLLWDKYTTYSEVVKRSLIAQSRGAKTEAMRRKKEAAMREKQGNRETDQNELSSKPKEQSPRTSGFFKDSDFIASAYHLARTELLTGEGFGTKLGELVQWMEMPKDISNMDIQQASQYAYIAALDTGF